MNELLRLLRYVRPYWPLILVAVFMMAIAGGMQGVTVFLIQPIFDIVLRPDARNAAPTLPVPGFGTLHLSTFMPSSVHNVATMVAIGILAVFLLKGLFDYLGNYCINYVGLSAVTDIRQRVFEKVLRQDAEFFENHSTGRLMSSIMNDLEKIQVALSHILADLLRQTFSVIALLYVVMQKDWKLALFSITVLPFVLLPTARLGRRIRRTTRTAQDQAGDLNQILQETIAGQQVVKSFGAEHLEASRFRKAAAKLRASNLRYVSQQALPSPIIEFFGAATIVGLLSYARTRIVAGQMTAGEFTAFVFALLMLYEPVKRLTGIHNIFQQALGATQTVFQYLDRDEIIREKPNAIALKGFHDAIRFENVSFRYPTSPAGFVLNQIELEVKAGEVVALVGPSGAGKTTFANLVPRFYDATSGVIRIDGHDLRDLQLASLREKIGIVAQDTFLFNDSVANNIRYGNRSASKRQVEEAARNALAEEFILAMPDGYETLVGERGVKLSGGQRQRIAIARALLKNAPILILDEATSHLDTQSERLVQRALANLMENRTVIVIAHRLSTVRRADKIVVLEKGRIRETGAHDELIANGGIYQRLHELQFLETDPLVNP